MADELWKTGSREARLLAGYLTDPEEISETTIEKWAADFNSWDIVDQVADAIWLSPFRVRKAMQWSKRPEEFVKRTGFVLMAGMAAEVKEMPDAQLEKFLPVISREAIDERNYVKKAVKLGVAKYWQTKPVSEQRAIALAQELAASDGLEKMR